MAIPDGVETVTINSCTPLTLPDGTLIRGHIRFVAPDLNLIADEDFIFGGESTAELCEGSFSITLVPPDATGITPTGWTYAAIAEFTNAPGWTRYVDITKDDPIVCFDDVIVLTPGDITFPDTTFVRLAGSTMTGPLILSGDPVVDLGAATKQYVDDAVDGFGATFVDVAGDIMTGPLVLSGDPVVALGAAPKQYVDQAEADAVTAATAAAAAESVSLSGDTMTGPLILSGAPATGLGAATKNYVDAGDDARVAVAGDTMTGELVLFGNPTVALGAAPKQYVDSQAAAAQAAAEAAAAAESVSLTGDTMTGALVLNADPVVALGAATKQFAEAEADAAQAAAAAESVSLSGDTMTGPLVLNADPSVALGAATKQYVDAAQAAADAESVSIDGDTMTGELVLFGNPTVALGAAPRQYVDAAQAAAEAAAAAESVSLSGDTMTGPLVLNADPVVALGASTKQYTEAKANAAQAAAEATAAAESVSLTGDTMSGLLILSGAPVVANGAANKGYVDGLDGQNVKLTGAQTIAGVKTFTSTPVGPASDPTTANELTRKAYVDALDAANVKLTGAQTINGVKTFGSIPVLPGTDPVAANEAVRKAYVDTLDAQNVKLTGSQTITGAKFFTSTLHLESATDGVASASLVGVETFDSYQRSHRGREGWGPGSGTRDTFFERIAAAVLQATSQIRVTGAAPLNAADLTRKDYVDTLDGANVKLTGAQTIAGVKTFSSIPIGPASDPTTANELTRKAYVDALDAANVKLTGAQTVAGVKTFSSIPVLPASDPTAANEATRKSYVDTLDAQNVKLTGAQTVAGIKTFSSIPVLPTSSPTTSNQATRKQYVDDTIASEILAKVGLSTGVITGGELNINAGDATKVDIGVTYGVVVDYTTTPATPTITKVNYPATTVQVTNLSDPITWLMLDSAGVLSQQTTRPTNSQRRSHLVLGGLLIAGGVISQDQSLPNYPPQTLNQLYDLMDAIGPFNVAGNNLSPAGANLQIAKSAGTVFNRGFNHFSGPTLTSDPHFSDTAAQNPTSMRYVTQNPAAPVAPVTSIIPGSYDNAGTITVMPGSNNTATIQRLFITPLNTVAFQVVVHYGQTIYASLSDAIAAVGSDPFVINENLHDATLLGYIVVRKGATDLSNAADGRVIQAARFSGNAQGSSASLSLSVLKTGDTMTGPLVLNADPSNVLGAATKQYVDTLDAQDVKLTGAQTVAGVKTFSSIPVGPASDPTTANQLTRKSYVDTLDGQNVKITGAQTVGGIKTFSAEPVVPTPTLTTSPTTKAYVDALDAANVKLTGAQTVAGVKTFSSIPVLPASDPTAANEATRKSYVDTLDGANVKLTGNQSISGVKTFSTGVVLSAGVNSTRSAVKAGATSRNTTVTPAADPDLVVAVEANARYDVTCIIGWTNGGGGMRVDFTGPSGATMLFVDNDGSVAATIGTDLTFSVTVGCTLKGTLITTGTSGNLTLRWAQNTSNAADTTLLTGCGLHVERVA